MKLWQYFNILFVLRKHRSRFTLYPNLATESMWHVHLLVPFKDELMDYLSQVYDDQNYA